MRFYIGTNFVTDDDPCLLLEELNLQSPDSKGFHRYQILTVMRNDKPVQFKTDLGKAEGFTADQIIILGGVKDEVTGKFYIEETVGRLKNYANRYRNKSPIDKDELPRRDIIKEFTEQAEMEIDKKKRGEHTHYGYRN
jgi:hypothetical protein